MDLSGLQLTESMLASMLSHSLDDDDLWNVETILGTDATNMLELEKDLQFLDATSAPHQQAPYNGLQIQTDNLNFLPDAIMNQVFATEPCYSPEPKPRPRNSLDMMTLEPLPLDHLSFVAQPTKRKSIVKINPMPPQIKVEMPPMPPMHTSAGRATLHNTNLNLNLNTNMNANMNTDLNTNLNTTMNINANTAQANANALSPKKCKQCITPGCTRRAQSNNRCKSHGGGARCTVPNCGKSSQGGGLCRAHGGGKKCKAPGCTKGTQRLGLCYLHGGIRRCTSPGCEKKDRGNGFCIAHGGGRKCSTPRCTRPARRGDSCQVHEEQKSGNVLLTLQSNAMNPDAIAFMGRAILQAPSPH